MTDGNLITQFHWLRPLWLLALIPAALLVAWLWHQTRQARQWSQLVDPQLLPHLLDGQTQHHRRPYLWGLLAAWVIASLALAGPSWEQRPMPVYQDENALVIVLDLSPSMLAEDLTPSRLARAQMKITDVLRTRQEGTTALVAYAGDAHVVSPLTADIGTIENLLRVLHPNIMPLQGSYVEGAIEQAQSLLSSAGMTDGQILLVTDGVAEDAVQPILNRLQSTDYRLSILGIGTPEGAPIPNDQGGFRRDRSDNIVVARLEEDRLERLAGRTGGRYERIDRSADDVHWLLDQPSLSEERHRQVEREFDTWYDRGHWLVLLLLPLVLFSFRRGLLAVAFCLPMISLYPAPAKAFEWDAPWLTPNQRGERRLERDNPEAAAELFDHPEWRGSALYRAGNYEEAAETFAQSDTARAHYNRGNALARAGALEEAIEAYSQALERDPELEDAQANRTLVEQLLEQQQEQEQQNGDEDQSEGSDEADPADGSDETEGSDQDPGDQNQPEDGSPEGDQESGQDDADAPEQEQDQPQGDDGQEQDGQDDEQAAQPEQQADEPAEAEEQPVTLEDSDISDEERQAMEQWLRRVPDDPGGLLRRKFEHQSQQRRLERLRGEGRAPDLEERW